MKTRPPTLRSFILHLVVLVSFLNVTAPVSWACMGTPQAPTCTRSIFLGKFVPRVVVVPPGNPHPKINVPIGVLPFVIWTKGAPCAQPVAASLSLTLTCQPVGGGMPMVIGPQMFTLPTPKTPGPQAVPGGVIFMIPAGTFPAGTLPQACTVAGTYTVTFGPGTGTGMLSATGDTEVCLVEPVPGGDPTIPRLDLTYHNPDPRNLTGFQTCRRGDQTIHWFSLTNNDPLESVILDLDSTGNQVARLPDGFMANDLPAAFTAMVHAISNPNPGTDTFPAAFADELAPGELIPETDPSQVDPQQLTRNNIIIDPLETIFIPIATRSLGMCADGSCSERGVRVTGLYEGGDDALACASTALLVSNSMRPKSPLVEFTERIKVNPRVDTRWGPGLYGDGSGLFHHSSTFASGNIGPLAPGNERLVLTGKTLARQFNQPFPDKATDNVRIDFETTMVQFTSLSQRPPNFEVVRQNVEIHGLDAIPGGKTFVLPLIEPRTLADSFFDIFVDITVNRIEVVQTNQSGVPIQDHFDGLLSEFLRRPPTTLTIDKKTCRTFTRTGSVDLPAIGVVPALGSLFGGSQNITMSGPTSFFDVVVNDPTEVLTRKPGLRWIAALKPVAGAALGTGTRGLIKTPVGVTHQIRGTAPAAPSNISWLHVHVAGAINSPFMLPINTRVVPDVFICDASPGGGPHNEVQANLESGDYWIFDDSDNFLSGRGKSKGKGADCTILDRKRDRLVQIEVNVLTGEGSANIQSQGLPGFPPITDTDAFATCP